MELDKNSYKALSDDEKKAVDTSRELAGLGALEVTNEEVSKVDKTEELDVNERKEEMNKVEQERIKKIGLKPGVVFKYFLLDWDENIQTVTITYPSTKQAIKYGKMSINNETGKAELYFSDTVELFDEDGLLTKFDINDYPVREAQELSVFLSRVVTNPRLK